MASATHPFFFGWVALLEEEVCDEEAEKVNLRSLRDRTGLSQIGAARCLYVSAARLHVLEKANLQDVLIRSIARYVNVMGGMLELWVQLEDGERVQLKIDE